MNPIKRFSRLNTYKTFWANIGLRLFMSQKGFTVKGPDETIEHILRNKVSVSRFGDGELYVIAGKGNGFQHPDKLLGIRLRQVLHSHSSGHIVCLPYMMENLSNLTPEAFGFWRGYLGLHSLKLLRMIPNGLFYDSTFTRFYMGYNDKSRSESLINKIRLLWENQDLYIVEGVGTRMGIGNDLLENAKSIKRILGPSHDAFAKYPQLLSAVKDNIPQGALVICALGMTATVLAYDLHKLGYWAIDIGHLDIEYEWFLSGTEKKIAIENKSVNEVGVNLDNDFDDQLYHSQIIYKVE